MYNLEKVYVKFVHPFWLFGKHQHSFWTTGRLCAFPRVRVWHVCKLCETPH